MEASKSSRLKVLLVEDDDLARKVAHYNLEDLNCDVESVSNGMTALELLSKRFDLILLDLGLPDIEGLVIAQHIRKPNGINSKTPLIALTAHVMESDRQACIDAGMDDYLQKPAAKEDLKQVISHYCTEREGA